MQNEPNIFADLLAGMRNLLAERLVSPLLPTFIASWLIVNYRVLLTIISDENLEAKFSIIDTVLFPSWTCLLAKGFLIPLVISLGYIFLYPIPSKWVYGYALNNQRKLREKRQEVEKARVYTVEESQKLMTYYYDRESRIQEQLSQRMQDIEQLRAKIAELEQAQTNSTLADPSPPLQATEPSSQKPLSIIELGVLKALSLAESQGKTYVEEENIRQILGKHGKDVTGLRIVLVDLIGRGLIARTSAGRYRFEHQGRVALKDSESQANNKDMP